MIKIIERGLVLAVAVFAVHFFAAVSMASPATTGDISGRGENKATLQGIDVAIAAQPQYTEAVLASLDGEIYINPEYTGKVSAVRTIDKNGLLGEKVGVETRIMTDGWRKFSLPSSMSGAYGVIVSGDEGILKLSRSEEPYAGPGGELKSINDDIIEFGSLSTTFTFPGQNVLEPSEYEIGVRNNADNSFINGNIIAMKSDQAAVEFLDLPPTSVNKEGLMHVSLKKPDGTFINGNMPAWGYNIMVPETEVNSPAPITAEVFGLPGDAEIRFDFTSLSGQIIDPSTRILTVGEINEGETVSTITTKFGGAQPLTVLVKRVK
jgi:hypothetical protein